MLNVKAVENGVYFVIITECLSAMDYVGVVIPGR